MIKSFIDIPGWFFWVDRLMFAAILEVQRDSPPGVLVELGTYLGKSAVIIGDFVAPEDRFVALDLFGRTDLLTETGATPDGSAGAEMADDTGAAQPGAADAGAARNQAEVQHSYGNLTRLAFEENYLALHDRLPEIVEGLSSTIVDYVEPATARFVHVDASHLFDQVRVDAQNTSALLRPGGVAVFDDWRSEHTPGVGAAVWEAVFTAGFIPLAITPYKFYGVYSNPEPFRAAIAELVSGNADVWSEQQQIAGYPVVRLKLHDRSKPARKPQLNDADLTDLADRLWTRLEPRIPLVQAVLPAPSLPPASPPPAPLPPAPLPPAPLPPAPLPPAPVPAASLRRVASKARSLASGAAAQLRGR